MTNDDNSIIERIRGGETSEFAQLVKRYGPSLMVFVGRIVGVQEDTEDVVQNTFVAAYQHMNDYDPQKMTFPTSCLKTRQHSNWTKPYSSSHPRTRCSCNSTTSTDVL